MQRKKSRKYHKYDFRQRNFPCHERRRIETLNKGACDANLCTYEMRKHFILLHFFFRRRKRGKFIYSISVLFSYAFHEITS